MLRESNAPVTYVQATPGPPPQATYSLSEHHMREFMREHSAIQAITHPQPYRLYKANHNVFHRIPYVYQDPHIRINNA